MPELRLRMRVGNSLLGAAWAFVIAVAGIAIPGQAADCSDDDSRYVCGIPSAEDLVQVPDTPWIIASAYSGPMLLNVIDARTRAWRPVYPTETSQVDHDTDRYPDCPGPVNAEAMVTHGLHIAEVDESHSRLHVVSHGARESIEVFDVHRSTEDAEPQLTWIGCVLMPDGLVANSVVALRDGSLLATVPIEPGYSFSQILDDVPTGAAHRWNPGTGSWQRLDATAQPYANGIEVSEDEATFYIASSGLRKVIAYSNTTAPQRLAETEMYPFVPDNLHRDADGNLITAGLILEHKECNIYNEVGEFDLMLYGSCPRPYEVISVESGTLSSTLKTTTLYRSDTNPDFSNITMGIVVHNRLWMGTFGGDRVAVEPIQ